MISDILILIGKVITNFNAYAKEFPIIAGAMSLWGLGVISYLMRSVPDRLWIFICKQTTTKLTLISTHKAYYDFLRWLTLNEYVNKTRSLKISSGQYGSDNKSIKSLGYGVHYFIHNLRPFKLDMTKKETISAMEQDEIIITAIGRSHKFFNKIFEEINKLETMENTLIVSKWTDGYFYDLEGQRKRDLNTVFINSEVKKNIVNFINTFINNENWYRKTGLNYQTGILFYGPPGTGKTSFVKAIASHFNKHLHILSPADLYDIEKAILRLPSQSILLIEDIDTDSTTNSRGQVPLNNNNGLINQNINNSNNGLINQNNITKFSFSNLSKILNSIDGIITCHGRILIATTNHVEKLSKALLREGRFDLKIKFDYADNNVVKQFFNNYYNNFQIPNNFNIKDEISAAKIQTIITNNLNNPNKALNELSK